MKKITIAAIVAAAALALTVSACQKKEAASKAAASSGTTLTVWCWDPSFNVYAMKEAAKIYEALRPDVKVNVVETPWDDIQQKLTTSLSAGQTASLPDIALVQDNAIQKNVNTFPKAFLPLNGKVDLSQFAQFKVEASTINGQSYAVPFDNGASATFLRRDIIESAGLKVEDFDNITWDRFIELGVIVKEKTGIAMISAVGNENDLVPAMLQSAGQWFFDADGRLTLADNAALKEAARVYKEMNDKGIIMLTSDWNGYVATLNGGTVASTVNGCWIIATISSAPDQSGKWAAVTTPRLNGVAGATNYSSVGGSSWVVLSSSKNQEAACDFLSKTFAGSVSFYETILPSSGAIATWLPAADSPVYAEPSAFFGGQKIYEDIVNYAAQVPRIKFGVFNYEARNNVALALQDIVNGAAIDAALTKAQKDTEFLMEQ